MKITTIGEILIDMTQTHIDENGNPHFAAIPGGAPANVAVAVSKLGGRRRLSAASATTCTGACSGTRWSGTAFRQKACR